LKFWKKKEPDFGETPDIAPPEKPVFDEGMSGFGAEPDLGAKPQDLGARPPGSEFPRPAGGLAPEQSPGFRAREAQLEVPTPPGMTAPSPAAESNKDFQLINAKLDTIKSGIDHINARLDKLEKKEEKEIVAWR
jgi:hypothetical protein